MYVCFFCFSEGNFANSHFWFSMPCQWPGFSIFKWTFQNRHVVNARWKRSFSTLYTATLNNISTCPTSLLFSVTRPFVISYNSLHYHLVAFEQQLTWAVAEKTGPAVIGIERPGMHQDQKPEQMWILGILRECGGLSLSISFQVWNVTCLANALAVQPFFAVSAMPVQSLSKGNSAAARQPFYFGIWARHSNCSRADPIRLVTLAQFGKRDNRILQPKLGSASRCNGRGKFR